MTVIALTAVLAASPATAQSAGGRHDDAGWGSVTVSTDRHHITVCDLSNDGRCLGGTSRSPLS
jgi:hypothetical protein